MRSVECETRDEIAPCLRVGGRKRRNACDRRLQIPADAEKRAVAKDARETIRRRREREPVREQGVLVGGEEARSGEHRKVHRAEVMTKTGQRQLSCLDRAAGLSVGFDDGDRPPPVGQPCRRRKAVVAGADHYGVISHRSPSASKVRPRRRAATIHAFPRDGRGATASELPGRGASGLGASSKLSDCPAPCKVDRASEFPSPACRRRWRKRRMRAVEIPHGPHLDPPEGAGEGQSAIVANSYFPA